MSGILVISGPSGSGKSSLMHKMMEEIGDTYFSVSTTTREKREGEVDGRDYFFVSRDEFEKDIEEGYFLEWAKVHDNYYGTSIKQIEKKLQEGKTVVLDIDVQGYKIAKEKLGDVITSVFITTPNQKTLRERLVKRGTDSKEIIEKRVKNALAEMREINLYDFFIINDDFETALDSLVSIVKASKSKTSSFDLQNFVKSWESKE